MGFIYQIIINALAIKAAAFFKIIPGFEFTGDTVSLLLVSTLFSLANFFLKPILKLLFGPLILLTLGLFTLVINMIILYAVNYFMPDLTITGIPALFWATILLVIANLIYSLIYKK